MLVHPGCYLSWTGKKTEHKRRHSPPVSELRPCRISQTMRFRWDFYSKLDDGKDRGQLWSDLIPSTSLGDCHALLGVTGKKSSGVAPRRSQDRRCAVRMAPRGAIEPHPAIDLKAEGAKRRPSQRGTWCVTFGPNCGISNVGHAVRGMFSGLQSPSGPPKASDSCPSGRP